MGRSEIIEFIILGVCFKDGSSLGSIRKEFQLIFNEN